MLKDCWSKKKSVEGNAVTSEKKMEDEWNVEVLCALEKDELARMTMIGGHSDHENDWIVD